MEATKLTRNVYPILCGGTFFTLLLEARKARTGKREQLRGKRDGLSEPETLIGLVRVMYPEYKEPSGRSTFRTNTADYKACRNNGSNLPFFDQETRAFDNCVRSDYQTALARMCGFVDQFIEVGSSVKRDEELVKALLDLIDTDQSIKDQDAFFACESGQPLTKAFLRSVTSICLPAFLLGVWHFVVVYRQNNTAGKDTFDEWCPPNNGSTRVYTGTMGRGITRTITVTVAETTDSEKRSDTNPGYSDPYANEISDNAAAESSSQTINNHGFIFQQFGKNNKQIVGNIDTLVINNDWGGRI